MRILYFTVDGRVTIEKTPLNARFIEMRDGYHPISNDSVWQDSARREDGIMCIFEGILGPYGSDMTEEDVAGILTEAEFIMRAHKRQSISRMWLRQLSALFNWVISYGMMLFVIGLSGYFIINAILEGAG